MLCILMYATGKAAHVLKEMRRYRLDNFGISKCKGTGSDKINTQTETRRQTQ